MAKERVSIKIVTPYDSKGIKKAQKDVSVLGKKVKDSSKSLKDSYKKVTDSQKKLGAESSKVSKKIKGGFKEMVVSTKDAAQGFAYHLTFIAWHFRYLGNIFSRIGQQWQRIVKDSINTAAELQESFLSIEVAAAMYGQSIEDSLRLTRELALTGLIPLIEAASSVKNLVVTGLGFSELEKFTYRYLDVAFLMTSGMDEMQTSLETMSKSIMRGTLVLSADVTARMLWTQTEKRLQGTIGVGMKQLSAKQKLLEILITIEENYAKTVGFHEIEEETLRATINKIITSLTLLKNAYGTALAPVLIVVADYIKKITDAVTELAPKINSSIALFTVLGLTITSFIGSVSFGIGVLISFFNIFKGISRMLGVAIVPFGKIALAILGIGAVLTAATYMILKHTGAWEKMKTSLKGISDRIAALKSEFEGLQEIQEEGDKDRIIAHQRKVEDIEEGLERERSKGLWANQMSIKDLEKRLRRENEDWNRYRGKLEKGEKEETKVQKTQLEIRLDNMLEMVKERADAIQKEYANIGKMSLKEYWKNLHNPNIWREGFLEVARIIGSWNGSFYRWAEELSNNFIAGLSIIFSLDFWREYFRTIGDAWIEFGRDLKEIGKAIAQGFLEAFSDEFKKMFPPLEKFEPSWKGFREFYDKLKETFPLKGLISPWMGFLPNFQFGGMIPGRPGQPVPIMAHGGERIVPSRETGGGGQNITINFNDAVVRESADLDRIAQKVGQILGQKARWQRLGA